MTLAYPRAIADGQEGSNFNKDFFLKFGFAWNFCPAGSDEDESNKLTCRQTMRQADAQQGQNTHVSFQLRWAET